MSPAQQKGRPIWVALAVEPYVRWKLARIPPGEGDISASAGLRRAAAHGSGEREHRNVRVVGICDRGGRHESFSFWPRRVTQCAHDYKGIVQLIPGSERRSRWHPWSNESW